jgi:hypothetical protein
MARKSVADLSVVPIPGAGRPPPPPHLDAIEAHIWRSVVDASPAFTIDPAAQVILRRLCAQAALLTQQEARLRQLRETRPDDDEEQRELAAAHGVGAKTVTLLMTSLRATPRSRTRLPRSVKVAPDKPWEDGLTDGVA